MATLQMTRATGPNQMAGVGDGQSGKSISMRLDFTSAVASGDVLTGPLIQSGSVVTDVLVITSGISTATINVGDATDPDRFVAAGTGAVIRSNVATARPWLVPQNTTINVTTGTAATTSTGYIDLTVYFQPRNT